MLINGVYEKFKAMKLPVAICVIALYCFVVEVSFGEQTSSPTKLPDCTEIEFDLCYEITPTPKSLKERFLRFLGAKERGMKLIVNVPQTIKGKQEITKLAFDPSPTKIFVENGNKYAEYILLVPKEKTRMKIQIEAKVFQYDLATAMKKTNQDSLLKPNLNRFLRHERMIEKNDPVIQNIAQTIQGQTELDIVKNIYRYVISNLTVDASKFRGVGAVETAQKKRGMCIDYCDLFVAICRAKSIPARVAAGYITRFRISPKHSWAEVYLKKYGWVPFDVIVSNDSSEESKDRMFYHFKRPFLKFTNLRNDSLLYNHYFYMHFNKGAPVKKALFTVVDSSEFRKPLYNKYNSQEDVRRVRKAGRSK